MIHSIRRLLSGLAATIGLVFVSALGLVECQSLRWSEIPTVELSTISVGQCGTGPEPGQCCWYSQWQSCEKQVGTNCVKVTISGNCIGRGLPQCTNAGGTPPPTCMISMLTIHTDTCTLNGMKNMDGSCQYNYVPKGPNSPTTQVCNCNPTWSICGGKQANPPCPTN